jgi:AcrR family transcriptional regulator
MSKRVEIMHSAARIIRRNGFNRLTLHAVAEEAEVSKGGLLYHFPNKERLVYEMNAYALARFHELIEEKRSDSGSYIKAYAEATLEELRSGSNFLINASLLATLADHKEVLDLWKEYNERWQKLFASDAFHNDEASMIRLLSDGIWFSHIFEINTMPLSQAERLLQNLLGRFDEGEM